MPKHRESPVLPPAIVRQPPLLLTSVTRSLYLWELWKILVSIPSHRRLLLLVINQSHERKKDSLPACDVNAWGMACHCWLVTSLCRALCNNIIVYGTSWASPGPSHETLFSGPSYNTQHCWWRPEKRGGKCSLLFLCRSLSSTRSSFLWVSSISEALTCWTSIQIHTCGTLRRVLHISHGPNQKLPFPLFFRGLKANDIPGYKAVEQMWTPISSLGKQ